MAVTNQYLGRAQGGTNSVTSEYAVTNGSVVYNDEYVYLDANGRVTSDSIAGKRLLGTVEGRSDADFIAGRTTALSHTGNAAGTVKVLVRIEKDARYLLKGDNIGTTLAVTHQGQYFDLIGNPGSQLVDTSTVTTTGQLVLEKFNPGIRGTDSTYGIYRIAENQIEL